MDVRVEQGLGGLGGRPVEDALTRVERPGMRMEYTICGRFDGLGLKTIGGWFTGLGLKTRPEVPRRNGAARGGITEVASR